MRVAEGRSKMVRAKEVQRKGRGGRVSQGREAEQSNRDETQPGNTTATCPSF